MEMGAEVKDRVAGVLLGQAVGDALGVPYEFVTPPIEAGTARMVGGGLGPFEPGEWSDDTQMAICVADATADYGPSSDWANFTRTAAFDLHPVLSAAAHGFIAWYLSGPADVGNLTRQVLGVVVQDEVIVKRKLLQSDRADASMMDVARQAAAGGWMSGSAGGTAGNGGLMRTAIVGVAALWDRVLTARLAAAVCALTHADPRCVESCILWSEAVRVAVTERRLDIRAGLDLLDLWQDGSLAQGWPGAEPPLRAAGDRRAFWEERIDQAEAGPVTRFNPNGFTVTALQAAWAAIHGTASMGTDPARFERALQVAISIGDDTDTVAAIAGGLLGGSLGVARIPADLARRVHGWPYQFGGSDLIRLALKTAGLTPGQEGPLLAP
ncbi:MAG: ADP-ribosylglycohydrolase family protein [Bifidobacteriaceae bacterium]|jgi:ADP-ribosylglycohydrolase|nr:ADP-ribosylglycohydrolase family protein [Bifidobacteriaceae bacterium]